MENKPEEPASQNLISSEQLAKIAQFIKVSGMNVEESCKLADFSYPLFMEILKKNSRLDSLIEKYQLEYKEKLLQVVNAAAQKGDKQAIWILERRYPEFSGKHKKEEEPGEDFVAQALKAIRSKPASIIDESQKPEQQRKELIERVNILVNKNE